jgi:hypothetical protein
MEMKIFVGAEGVIEQYIPKRRGSGAPSKDKWSFKAIL